MQAREGSARSPILGGHVGVRRNPSARFPCRHRSPQTARSQVVLRLQAAGAGLGAIGACTEGMHGLKPYPALAVAISELPIAIAFAPSTIILPPLWGL